jgi:hypothetical protein
MDRLNGRRQARGLSLEPKDQNKGLDSSADSKNMKKISSYKDLIVWQRSMDLVERIYQATSEFPSAEQ